MSIADAVVQECGCLVSDELEPASTYTRLRIVVMLCDECRGTTRGVIMERGFQSDAQAAAAQPCSGQRPGADGLEWETARRGVMSIRRSLAIAAAAGLLFGAIVGAALVVAVAAR